MGTRALYTFKDAFNDADTQFHVYKHWDGYPSGACGFIAKAAKLAWPLPRFEADEFGAAFIAANKGKNGGDIRLLATADDWRAVASSDLEYRYVITEKGGKLHITAYNINCPDWDKPTEWQETELFAGTLAAFKKFVAPKENAKAA